MNQAKKTSNETQVETTQVVARVPLLPVFLVTFITGIAAAVLTLGVSRYFDKKKREEEAARELAEREEAASNPSMPMMWPGMGMQQFGPQQFSGQQQPQQIAANVVHKPFAERVMDRGHELTEREATLLRVMGGGEE